MSEKRGKAYLDVAVRVCPHCGALYADASWYVIGLESDVECGTCGNDFNPKKSLNDRVLVQFDVDARGKVSSVREAEISADRKNRSRSQKP